MPGDKPSVDLITQIDGWLADAAAFAWGTPLVVLILGGGLYFLWLSGFLPFRYLGHSVGLLSGRYDRADDPGDITHFQALSSALAGTIGMGNIAGVAVAITVGGPGAVFWMWMTAIVGIATKFFTCSLAVMYRGRDSQGQLQGGPMYVITEGLGPRYKPLATLFCLAGVIGCLPLVQINQLVQTVREVVFIDQGWLEPANSMSFNFVAGLTLATIVALVIFGGLTRIAQVAGKLVPTMALLYIGSALFVVITNLSEVPSILWLIITDAFTGAAVAGGAIGAVISNGVRRGVFSNEAGVGTEAMAHGAAKTQEPIREGLVAMVGPIIDTLFICTCTAIMILLTGVWETGDANGVTLTARAFEASIPHFGLAILVICIVCFGVSTIFSYSYYGAKCLGFLVGAERQHYYNYLIVIMTVVAALMSIDAMVNLIDLAFACMAIPTMSAALLLSRRVMIAARVYFAQLDDTSRS
jgi:AGCS family alanine or glycine:cation symporter